MDMFPEGFLWGATISAHRVEGANYQSDWWRWEQRPNRIADGATSARAADHFNRWKEDLTLADKLGLNALLISLPWGRIQPAADAFDADALNHYAAVFDAVNALGMTPVCVLHEVTRPRWFAEGGGWSQPEAPVHYGHYVNRVAQVLGRRCRWYLPIWEPEYTMQMRFIEHTWPGGESSRGRSRRHMARAHVHACQALHGLRPDAQVGLSVRTANYVPRDENSPWDVRAAQRMRQHQHHAFLEAVHKEAGGGAVDFIGISYYGRQRVRFALGSPRRGFMRLVDGQGRPISPERTQTDPQGMRGVVAEMARYERPCVVTAHGIATGQDPERCVCLLDQLHVLRLCIAAGHDIRGYFHHSLLDGFEYTRGYRDRYGLVHVDRENLARTPNGSAFLYQDVAKNNSLRTGARARFCPDWTPPEEAAQ